MATAGVINKPVGFAYYSDLAAAKKLSNTPAAGVTIPDGSIRALIQADGADVRWRDDGTAPTGAVGGGMLLKDGTVLEYEGNLETIQFIETAVAGGIVVSYYRY